MSSPMERDIGPIQGGSDPPDASQSDTVTRNPSSSKDERLVEAVGMDEKIDDTQALEAAVSSHDSDAQRRQNRRRIFLRAAIRLIVWLVITGWWIAGLILHRHDLGWLVPFLVWLSVTVWFVTFYYPLELLTSPLSRAFRRVILAPVRKVTTSNIRLALLSIFTLAVILTGTFCAPGSSQNTRVDRLVSLVGWLIFLGGMYCTSKHRRAVDWQLIVSGILLQFVLGYFVLRTKAGYDVFAFLGNLAATTLGFSAAGTAFLTNDTALSAGWFLITVLPVLIFFVALASLLTHWGWLPWFLRRFAQVFRLFLGSSSSSSEGNTRRQGVSAAEAVVAAASPFLGQGESAVLVRTLLPRMTKAEIHQVMASGFATIAGSVLAAYMGLGISPVGLVSSCVMSIPAAVVASKLRYPETQERQPLPEQGVQQLPVTASPAKAGGGKNDEDDEKPFNSLHAVANGAWLGLKIAGMVTASILAILGLLALTNGLLGWWGRYINIEDLTIQLILGYVFFPVAFLLGVERDAEQLRKVAQLIGIKIVANEFVAYGSLSRDAAYAGLSPRSRLIATYALCGFGNISGVGIQIGALSQLAPRRARAVAELAVSALVSGIIATLTSANIAGMIAADEPKS